MVQDSNGGANVEHNAKERRDMLRRKQELGCHSNVQQSEAGVLHGVTTTAVGGGEVNAH